MKKKTKIVKKMTKPFINSSCYSRFCNHATQNRVACTYAKSYKHSRINEENVFKPIKAKDINGLKQTLQGF